MTLFAVMCAGLFPVIHMGRPWLFYWMLPYPNDRGSLWINFRSPLVWDFFAISTYFVISLVFWYVGLVPDLATLRDRVKPGWYQRLLAFFSLGWNGSGRTWHRYESVYLLLAGLATPLVVSVHSVVSTDFAITLLPGWHTTLFPPYFVAGAIFSGMAMVLTLMLIARKTMHLEDYITTRHVDAMTKLVLATSGLVGLAYLTEIFTALYSGNFYEHFALMNRLGGNLAWGYWLMVACNVLIPQLFWFRWVRTCLPLVFVISILVNVGMWFERFIIIVTALERDFLPSSWADYAPTSIELATLAGSFGLFFTCFLLFCRFLPAIAIAEVKGILDQPHHRAGGRVMTRRTIKVFSSGKKICCGRRNAANREGWQIVDIYTPYPVHETARLLGLARSRLPRAAFVFGAVGRWPGVLVPVLGVGLGLAPQCRRPAVELAAGLCAGGL